MQPDRQGFRLSPQQERLWVLQQECDVYRAQCSVRLTGDLHAAVLEAAVRHVVARHEMLRTTFYRPEAMQFPLQCVADSSLPTWHTVDLSAWSASQQAAQIAAHFQQAQHWPFDLEHGPLLRVALLVLSASSQVLLISLPALCADVWTLQNLLHEISQAYAAYRQGKTLSDEPIQYVQFSEWQNALLEDVDAESGKNYWSKQDLQVFSPLTLPFAKPVDNASGFTPDVFVTVLDAELVTRMRALVQQYETSLPAFLLAGWQTLLWRLSGQPDMIVGYVCDGRKYAELHGVLGLLAKWVPLHGHCEANYTYRDLLEQVQDSMRQASQWQEYFTPDAEHGLAAETVDMPIGFAFEVCAAPYAAAGVSWVVDRQYVCSERFKVQLTCVQQDETLLAAFYYDTHVFDGEDITCLAEQFQTLLASATDNPEAMLGALDILSKAARQRLLVEFNNTTTDVSHHACIHHLFEAQVARTPEKIAVVCEGQSLTYAALNARSNQLAHHLQRLGVGPEVRVAMCLERSLQTVVGLLGILKAGGAYVPLDPGQPPARLAFMVEHTQAPVLLTQERFGGAFAADNTHIICLDRDWGVIAPESDEKPLSQATDENLVYVMYTSGSTGTPKGVAVEHRQLLNYVQAIVAQLGLPADARFAVVSTFAADLGHTTVFPALCRGGCLHIVSQDSAFDPEALAAYFRLHPIDCLKIVPSHLAALLACSQPAHILPRQRLILGGEACGWEVIETLQALAPECRICNHYGPTEATVGAMTYPVAYGHTRPRTGQLPLGSPLANMQVYILDVYLQPAPIGVPGELCIGGAGLARGYLRESRLTAEKFVPNPWSDTPGARLYKTGDRARFLPDCSIEFLGRVDHQVKLRGFRIELGEIETALSHHPGVRETVVVARQDSPGNIQLVAYVVPNQQQMPAAQDLRHWLQEKLPDYMVPAAFVFLKALPLTANGKVDRQAMPAPGHTVDQSPGLFVPPRTAVEEVLAGIWSELLGLTQVGVHDNFFELGGHSLLGIQVLARVRQAFRVELPPRDLFEAPTVASLATALVKHEAQPGQVATIARLRQDIEKRSAEDIRALLQEKRQAQR